VRCDVEQVAICCWTSKSACAGNQVNRNYRESRQRACLPLASRDSRQMGKAFSDAQSKHQSIATCRVLHGIARWAAHLVLSVVHGSRNRMSGEGCLFMNRCGRHYLLLNDTDISELNASRSDTHTACTRAGRTERIQGCAKTGGAFITGRRSTSCLRDQHAERRANRASECPLPPRWKMRYKKAAMRWKPCAPAFGRGRRGHASGQPQRDPGDVLNSPPQPARAACGEWQAAENSARYPAIPRNSPPVQAAHRQCGGTINERRGSRRELHIAAFRVRIASSVCRGQRRRHRRRTAPQRWFSRSSPPRCGASTSRSRLAMAQEAAHATRHHRIDPDYRNGCVYAYNCPCIARTSCLSHTGRIKRTARSWSELELSYCAPNWKRCIT